LEARLLELRFRLEPLLARLLADFLRALLARLLDAFFRPLPDFFPPPVRSFTVAHARRSASFVEIPSFL